LNALDPGFHGVPAGPAASHSFTEKSLKLATDPPLPRRVPRARPKPPAEIVTDLDILRRLRDHLSS